MDPLGRNLGGRVPSRSRHVRVMRLSWQQLFPSNGALNIQQLWASAGRTREPVLMKFGTQQQIRPTMTVTWSNVKIFKIQDDGRPPPCWKIFELPLTRLRVDRLGRNVGDRIPACAISSHPPKVGHLPPVKCPPSTVPRQTPLPVTCPPWLRPKLNCQY